MRVAIIGGGVIGLTTAYALINKGHKVELYEQNDQVGMATSFANGGQLSYRYVTPLADAGVPWQALGWMIKKDSPLRFRPRMSLEQWHWCWQFLQACRTSVNQTNTAHLLRLALHSQSVLHDWQAQYGLTDFGWRANGKMVIYRQHQQFKHAASKITPSSPQQVLSVKECVEAEPSLANLAPHLQGGIFSPGDEVGDCYLFCQQLLQQLNAHPDFTLHASHTVDKLILEKGHIRGLSVTNTQDALTHQVDVEHLVVAAGMGSKKILDPAGIKVPLYPLKGYSLTLPVTDNSTVPHTNVTDYDQKIVYARLKDQLRVAAMVDIGHTTTTLDAKRIAALRHQAQHSFPKAGDYQNATPWAGLRPATPQGTPLLGRSGIKNLWLNLGHGSLGFTLACASAACLSQVIDDEPVSIALTGLQL
ncbi:MAG: D-amino acid dehydrogenase [Oceanisphaera sp.]|uniref:D-amino acid dehydrogenase n=1 Tax=Oceanisphaera sp. TaxID=1929979 RepID=UPI003F997D65